MLNSRNTPKYSKTVAKNYINDYNGGTLELGVVVALGPLTPTV